MSDNLTRSREIPRLLREFQVILEHYEGVSRTDEEKRRFVEIAEHALFDITLEYTHMGYVCPVGYDGCPGGGCVPRGRTCRDYIRVTE